MSIDRTTTGLGFVLAVATMALVLSGCGTATTQQKTVAGVSASQASLTAAGKVILACYSVPKCAAAAPKAQIKKAFDTAYDAVTAAQATADAGGTPDVTAETAAIAALQALVTQLPTS